MSLDDEFDDDDEYQPKKPIMSVEIEEIERDWKNRMVYFAREYINAELQYKKLKKDKANPNYELIGWFDPNERLYFYETHSKGEEETKSELQSRLEQMFGIKGSD